MQSWSSEVWPDARDRLFLRNHPFAGQIDGDTQSGKRRGKAIARLEHVEASALDRKLDVLHIAVVHFEAFHSSSKLTEYLRHRFLHRGRGVTRFIPCVRGQGLRRANTGHHIFSLGVDRGTRRTGGSSSPVG